MERSIKKIKLSVDNFGQVSAPRAYRVFVLSIRNEEKPANKRLDIRQRCDKSATNAFEMIAMVRRLYDVKS